MPRDEEHICDILDAAALAISYVEGKERNDFLADVQLQDAVIRRLEIIGEAGRRISDNTRAAHPSVPWHDIVSMRNFLIHEYDGVDMDIVWDTVQSDLPKLISALEGILPLAEG